MGTQKKPKETSSKKPQPFNFSYFAGITAKMIGIIVGGALLGHYIDKHVHYSIPIFTLILSMLSVFLAIYVSVKGFSN